MHKVDAYADAIHLSGGGERRRFWQNAARMQTTSRPAFPWQ
jgi:hypothetical protein